MTRVEEARKTALEAILRLNEVDDENKYSTSAIAYALIYLADAIHHGLSQ